MMRTAFVLILLLWSSIVHAEKRVALVIGNGAYQKVSSLPNPTNDAKAIAGMLRAAAFDEVTLHENLGFRELRQAIKDFSNLTREADTAVVYYSGHGIEANGINYLVPTDAALDSDIDVPFEAYSLDNLVQALEPARRLRLVMLDACRDNPFARSMKRTIASRAVAGGLAPVEPTSVNTLIGFAAKAGSIALDGDGPNSPYTTALLNHMTTPGLDLRIAFGRVRDEVLKLSRNKQEPFVYGSLGGSEIALVSTRAPQQIGPVTPSKPAVDYDKEMEITFWNAVKDAKSVDLLKTYLDRYPAGNFAGLAKVLIERLAKAAADAESARQSTTVVAALPPGAKPTGESMADQAKLARALQTELKRVGCDPGALDGRWSTKAKEALREFSRSVNLALSVESPTEDALRAVAEKSGRICRLTCSPHEKEQNGRCVATATAEPAHRPAPQKETAKSSSPSDSNCFTKCWAERGSASASFHSCASQCRGH
jgi:hypothetical protein